MGPAARREYCKYKPKSALYPFETVIPKQAIMQVALPITLNVGVIIQRGARRVKRSPSAVFQAAQ
jgi:hypothetical protein